MNLLKIYEAKKDFQKWRMGNEIGSLKLNYDDQSHRFKFHDSVRTLNVNSVRDPFKNNDYMVTDTSGEAVGSGYFLKQDGETFIFLKMKDSKDHYLVHVHTKSNNKVA